MPAAKKTGTKAAASEVPFVLERYSKVQEGEFDELDFTDVAVSDEHVKLLCDQICETASKTSLRRLVLQRCQIGVKGLQELGNLLGGGISGETSPLVSLCLSGNDIGPEGVPRDFLDGLKGGKCLRSLDLSCCCLGDEGVVSLLDVLALRLPAVREAPELEELRLGCNRITPVGAKTLSRCLATNMKLRTLDLKANELGLDGAKELVEGLKANKGRLKKLDVSQNELKHQGAQALADFFLQREFRYTISLERPRGKPTGFALSQEMVVTNISLKSVIDSWNQEHPSDAVLLGDKVLKVNEQDVREEMLEELREKEEQHITLLRTGGLVSLDMTHNMITLNGVKEMRKVLDVPAAGNLRGWQLSFDGGEREMWLSAH